jgi:hypothetical protein
MGRQLNRTKKKRIMCLLLLFMDNVLIVCGSDGQSGSGMSKETGMLFTRHKDDSGPGDMCSCDVYETNA